VKKIFSILLALALVLGVSLVAVPVVEASPANGDVTIVVQDQAGSPIAGATATLLFYGGGKGGYNMPGKSTDGSGSATFNATEIATWLTANGYNPSSQIYVQPGAKVETASAYGRVRSVNATTGFPCIPYNTPGGNLVPKPAMSFTYNMIMMSTASVQTIWDDPANDFTVTATLAESLSVTPDVTRMRLIRNLVGAQPPAPGGSDDDWWMWNGTAYEQWKGISTVGATAAGSSVSATFSQNIFSDWQVGNKVIVRAEFGVNRTVGGVSCIDDYYSSDISRPSSYIHPAQIDDSTLFYPTIQDAVDAASSGDTIQVAAGTYVDDLTIPATKTNVELVGATGAKIKGVQELDWPNHAPAISVLASGVKIHGFTIESPDYSRTTGNPHSSGITVGVANVEIYDNAFVATDDGTGNSAGWCTMIETYGQWGGDISGLNIHNNTFTSTTGTDKGSEGVYINYNQNVVEAGTATIANNTFGGQIFRAITTERSNTTITGNTIGSSFAASPAFNAALRGIDVFSSGRNPNIDTVAITGNTINGFWQGIHLGASGDVLTNISVANNTVKMNTTGVKVDLSANGVVVKNNSIIDNTTYGVHNADTTNTLDATYNWWGDASGPYHATTNPSGTGNAVSDNVDYSPWWGANYIGAAHPWSWYTNDSIQDAIDAASAGDTINVVTGTYNGFEVTKDDLTIQGPTNAVVSGAAPGQDAVVYIGTDVDSATIQGLTIDAAGVTIGIEATESGTYSSIAVLGSTIKDFKKGGIVVQYASAVQLEDNSISTTDHSQAPNGIQIGYVGATTGTTGTVNDNQISGCHWDSYDPETQTYEEEWTGSGILVIDTNSALEISDNEVHSCDVGMDIESGTPTTITNNNVHDNSYGFVLWNAAPTINHNNIYQNALCGVYCAAGGSFSTVDAEENWWGDASGPSDVGYGTGDAVSSNVDYDPWLDAPYPEGGAINFTAVKEEAVTDDIFDAKSEADTEVLVEGSANVTAGEYSHNPGSGFSGDIGKYIDVHIDDASGVTELEIRLYYTDAEITGQVESSLTLRWWNGTGWVACSPDSGVNTANTGGYSGYMWAKITATSTPSLDDLEGTPLGGSSYLAPTVTTKSATGVAVSSAYLNTDYTMGDYSSVQVRFAYKKSAGSTWSYTAWVSKSGSGSYSKKLLPLDASTQYDFKGQLKYDDTVISGATLQFTTTAEVPGGVPGDGGDGGGGADGGGADGGDGGGGGGGAIGMVSCFIATAAYGTPSAEQIDVLREFRDVVLLESTVGSQFVALYYQLSPPVADVIAGDEVLRTLVRELLVDPIVWVVDITGDLWRN
jgi:parallel beta-helix repeat protein